MSSINPNPKSSTISQTSTSNPPQNLTEINHKKKKKKKKSSMSKRRMNKLIIPEWFRLQEGVNLNWLELPEDIWFQILSKLKTIDIIKNAQFVCRLFQKLCEQPSLFKTIDMRPHDASNRPRWIDLMTGIAVDRSAGGLIDLFMEYVCDDETFLHVAERAQNLKHLRLGQHADISDETLIEALQLLPMLEELQLFISPFSEEIVEAVGRTCPSLKSFSLTHMGSKNQWSAGNEEALDISRSMPQLRHLQLIGNSMTNEGLKAILDGCPLLESLDLRACFHIDLSGSLGKRCARIKHLRRPNDSTADYGRLTSIEEDPMYKWRAEQENRYDDYDYDIDSYMFGSDVDLFDLDDLVDDYYDFFDDDDMMIYFGGGGFMDFVSSG